MNRIISKLVAWLLVFVGVSACSVNQPPSAVGVNKPDFSSPNVASNTNILHPKPVSRLCPDDFKFAEGYVLSKRLHAQIRFQKYGKTAWSDWRALERRVRICYKLSPGHLSSVSFNDQHFILYGESSDELREESDYMVWAIMPVEQGRIEIRVIRQRRELLAAIRNELNLKINNAGTASR